MKIGSKVQLKQTIQQIPANVSTPRGADLRNFDKGAQFTLINTEGEKATVKDSDGNFWTVLMEFLGLVTEATQVNQNTTIGEGASLIKRFIGWLVARFKKKK
jgi:hypothetical protein